VQDRDDGEGQEGVVAVTLEILDCEQGSEDWYAARMGLVTASELKKVLAKSKELRMRTGYMRKLAGEILTGRPAETYRNADMERGHEQEPEALELYCYATEAEPEKVGFVLNRDLRAGWSPDALIGWNAAVEIKTVLPHIMVEIIEADKFPTEFEAQVQGGLWIGEREWCDLCVYCPGMPLFIKRACRDDAFIKKIAHEVEVFQEDLARLVERVRNYRTPDLKSKLAASVLLAG
jgi:hypothetical protein